MNSIEPKYGVALYHLKDKFAYGSTTGKELSEFKYDEQQIQALFNFLHNGAFEGMFDVLSLDEYKNFIELHYLSLARNTMYPEVRNQFAAEFSSKVRELEDEQKKPREEKEPQAE